MPRCPPRKDVPFAVDVRGFETTIRNEPRIGIVKTANCAQAPIAVFTMPMRGYAFVTFHLFQLPDISVVLCNSSVGGEESGLGDVH